jgi:hypothetical protein
MEQHVAAGTDNKLVDSLTFELPSVANYILERTQTTFVPARRESRTLRMVCARFVSRLQTPMLSWTQALFGCTFDLLNTTPNALWNGAATDMSLLRRFHMFSFRGLEFFARAHSLRISSAMAVCCTLLRRLKPQNRVNDDSFRALGHFR